jgi:hypothetical protein
MSPGRPCGLAAAAAGSSDSSSAAAAAQHSVLVEQLQQALRTWEELRAHARSPSTLLSLPPLVQLP